MGEQDRALRSSAIPYYANVWGYNRGEQSDQDISSSTNIGDLANLIPSSYFGAGTIQAINPVRVLQPVYGDIIEANLNLKFKLRGAESTRQFRVAIGEFDGLYDAETSYSESYIDESHKKITGRETPFSIAGGETFNVARLNLYPAMYHRGNEKFRDDAFVVLLVFDQAPSKASGYTFTKFEVDCTAQMGLY